MTVRELKKLLASIPEDDAEICVVDEHGFRYLFTPAMILDTDRVLIRVISPAKEGLVA